jgi:hypothetical protein
LTLAYDVQVTITMSSLLAHYHTEESDCFPSSQADPYRMRSRQGAFSRKLGIQTLMEHSPRHKRAEILLSRAATDDDKF